MLLPAASSSGQRPIQLSLAAGASAPQGTLSDATTLGWHVLGAVNVNSLFIPLGLRLEGAYNRIPARDDVPIVGGDVSIVSITGNMTYRWPMTNSVFSPYLLGGMGAYQTDCETVCEDTTSFGWNFGLGTKLYLLGFRSFLEARFHSTTRDGTRVNYIPVSLGITF
jgi:hypothetical protein